MSRHLWQKICSLGLCPGVSTLEEYERRVQPRLILATDAMACGCWPEDPWEPVIAQRLHALIFELVHPWAGNWREPGQLPIVGGLIAADSIAIPGEMERLRRQTAWLRHELTAVPNALLAGAFHHARFERIHPFLDGNGRTGRAVLLGLLARAGLTLDLEPVATEAGRQRYLDALREAPQDLRPLVEVLAEHCNVELRLPAVIPPPFRIPPVRDPDSPPEELHETMNWKEWQLATGKYSPQTSPRNPAPKKKMKNR